MPAVNLLFVCSGNICRSPMAEVMAIPYGAERGLQVHARSAGTLMLLDRPAHPHSLVAVEELGLDLSAHRSQGVTEELLAWADHVPVMSPHHAQWIRSHHPTLASKVLLLGTFEGSLDVPDPIGQDLQTFRSSRDQIAACVRGLLGRLA